MSWEEGSCDFVEAVRVDDLQRLSRLMSSKRNSRDAKRQQEEALIYAVRNGKSDFTKLLLDFRVDANTVCRQRSEPCLLTAAKLAHVDIVGQLLAAGANPNTTNDCGETAVHFASSHYASSCDAVKAARTSCLKLLLDAGANPGTHNEINGRTPLMNAATSGDPKCLELLLAAQADPNASMKNGRTALMNAANCVEPECIRVLVRAGANTEAKTSKGERALHFAACYASCLSALLQFCTDLDALDGEGATALIRATKKGKTDCIKLLLAAGADPELCDADGFPALAIAAQKGDVECFQALLEGGADMNCRCTDGRTVLEIAIEEGHFSLKEFLKQAGITHDRPVLAKAISC